MTKAIPFMLALAGFLSAQPLGSPHAADQAAYGDAAPPALGKLAAPDEAILPLQYDKAALAGKVVFGYLPDWEYPTAKANLRYEYLTHVACFDFMVDPDGTIHSPGYWPWTDLINEAHGQGVRTIVTLVNFDRDHIRTILETPASRNKLYGDLIAEMNARSMDGVNVDFENLYDADKGAKLVGFLEELTDTIHAVFPDAEVSFAGPAVNWGDDWDLDGIAAACDYVFIMGYAFYGSWSATTGPTAPFRGGSRNIFATVVEEYGSVITTAPEKLVLGVPYYGTKWECASDQPHAATVSGSYSSPRFRTARPLALEKGERWASDNYVPYVAYQEGGAWYQVWYDNDSSLYYKYGLADHYNLRGVGMWALGYDGTRDELWDALDRHVFALADDRRPELPEDYALGAYPNPFNAATQVYFRLPERSVVTLVVYNIVGKRIATLAEGEYAEGLHTVVFEPSDLSSGAYFARLTTRKGERTTNLLLLK